VDTRWSFLRSIFRDALPVSQSSLAPEGLQVLPATDLQRVPCVYERLFSLAHSPRHYLMLDLCYICNGLLLTHLWLAPKR
jgi:hypothetical protein